MDHTVVHGLFIGHAADRCRRSSALPTESGRCLVKRRAWGGFFIMLVSAEGREPEIPTRGSWCFINFLCVVGAFRTRDRLVLHVPWQRSVSPLSASAAAGSPRRMICFPTEKRPCTDWGGFTGRIPISYIVSTEHSVKIIFFRGSGLRLCCIYIYIYIQNITCHLIASLCQRALPVSSENCSILV